LNAQQSVDALSSWIWSRVSRPTPQKFVIERVIQMLWTIFVILLILWLLGMVTSTTLGGFIHLLLIIAIAVVLIRVIQGRRPI
jgi:hypothetical protein